MGVLACVWLPGCGASSSPRPTAVTLDRLAPHWEDAFERTPEILVFARPQALRRDAVYGPLVKMLSALAAARAPAGVGARSADAFESADEVVVGLCAADEMVVVIRGVRPDLDPERLTDPAGLPLWSAARDHARTPELVHDRGDAPVSSLFVLPQRTWVLASGAARGRVREAFASPLGRSAPPHDDRALIALRLDGPSLVRSVPRLDAREGLLAPIGRDLRVVTLVLGPAKEGVVATFAYADVAAATASEATLRRVVDVLARERSGRTAWLGSAKIGREGRDVRAHVDLPASLLQGLPNATPADLGL